ncbi:MAG TPA: GatB/YqeY domain-containing protein [Anaerolineales bacterium]|nr:GatB/YqeY domain-containing protein [Anaerolineales bacterium]
MEAKKQLESGLTAAIRAGDDVRKRTLRMAISAVRQVEVDRGKPLTNEEVIALLQKEVKTRQEVIEESGRAGRPDLQAEAQAEIEILQGYLPQQLSRAELEAEAREVIAELGASSLRDMGTVMKTLQSRLAGRASGSEASQVVRSLLQN